MAGKKHEIKCVSYVRVKGEPRQTTDLSAQQKKELGIWLLCTFLNQLYAGKAKFQPR